MNTQQNSLVWTTGHKVVLALLLAFQVSVAYVIGVGHWLPNDAQSLIPPIGITAVIPVAAFMFSYWLLPSFRRFVLAQDIRLLTAVQLWRVVGLAFLLLNALNFLPALFALPAGLGDVAIGLMAFYVLTRMDRDADFVTSSSYLGFQFMGLLDFAVAIATSGLAAGAYPNLIPAGLTSAPMDVWPLNIFPSCIVPMFIILQLAALLNVREMRRTLQSQPSSSLQPA